MPEAMYEFQEWFQDPDVQRELNSVRSLTGATMVEACLIFQIASLTAALVPDEDDDA